MPLWCRFPQLQKLILQCALRIADVGVVCIFWGPGTNLARSGCSPAQSSMLGGSTSPELFLFAGDVSCARFGESDMNRKTKKNRTTIYFSGGHRVMKKDVFRRTNH